ncbi:hypothetical protein BN7_5469 [Wickerhamomyces ciferrii]|uniref:Uncharacterized protein n=1 Tax=Wickerhamomyces ciferrii (strain ATCC 14091 / BCRC 22168 / CBS 111 / JCM 3599 / NBRC 0793 / NRRL Y-1031 F-60-10) TaxID=1206466 RepID=K0KVE4_WICCF|nr:uncharacterized protein BN7_5469 [Wickerhamomyces ciferrii]CCH45882.1 hypothetical protein BN7_5469 [Wickerhamomyces ciferrii]
MKSGTLAAYKTLRYNTLLNNKRQARLESRSKPRYIPDILVPGATPPSPPVPTEPERDYFLKFDYMVKPLDNTSSNGAYTQLAYGESFLKQFGRSNAPFHSKLNALFGSSRVSMDIATFEIVPKRHINDPFAHERSQVIMIIKNKDYELDDVLERLLCFPNSQVNEISSIFNQNKSKKAGIDFTSTSSPDFMFFNSKPENFEIGELVHFLDVHSNGIKWESKHYWMLAPLITTDKSHFHNCDSSRDFIMVIDEDESDDECSSVDIPELFSSAFEKTQSIDYWNFFVGHNSDLDDF